MPWASPRLPSGEQTARDLLELYCKHHVVLDAAGHRRYAVDDRLRVAAAEEVDDMLRDGAAANLEDAVDAPRDGEVL